MKFREKKVFVYLEVRLKNKCYEIYTHKPPNKSRTVFMRALNYSVLMRLMILYDSEYKVDI